MSKKHGFATLFIRVRISLSFINVDVCICAKKKNSSYEYAVVFCLCLPSVNQPKFCYCCFRNKNFLISDSSAIHRDLSHWKQTNEQTSKQAKTFTSKLLLDCVQQMYSHGFQVMRFLFPFHFYVYTLLIHFIVGFLFYILFF